MSTSKIFYEVVSGHGQRKSSVEEAERSKMSHSYGVRIRGVAGVGYECNLILYSFHTRKVAIVWMNRDKPIGTCNSILAILGLAASVTDE